jgi:protease-4
VHQHFIHYVIQGRGERLHGNPKKLFSGDFWTGDEAVKLGLADGTGQLWTVLRKDFKVEQYRDYSYRPSLLRDIVNDLRASVGFSLAQHLSPISAKLNT